MGASAILIILCHAPAYVELPSLLSLILTRGGWGVDIFLFLSGVGLFHSLYRIPDLSCKSLVRWYIHRFYRLLLPYFLSYVPLCILRGLIRHDSIINIISDISTVSFWTRHGGPWFIALIIPLYIIAPMMYSFFQRSKADVFRFISMLSLIVFCVVFSLIRFDSVPYHGLLDNIQYAFSRVPAFILGLYSGRFVHKGCHLKYPKIFCISIVLISVILKYFIPELCVSVFMALPVVIVLSFIFSREYSSINKICEFMGKISLESYLFNGILPYFIVNRVVYLNGINLFQGNYISYLFVIVFGILLSYFVHRLSNYLRNKVVNYKDTHNL